MKIYDFTGAPNPRRVRVFLAEKGVKVPFEQVNILAGDNRKPPFLAKNPMGGLPVLEFDDGTCLAESIAICRYFEEQHPSPPLFGTDAKDRAMVEMWNRRIELGLFRNVAGYFQNSAEMFKARGIKQVPAFAEVSKENFAQSLGFVDSALAKTEFLAGSRYTVADITTMVAIDFGKFAGLSVSPDLKNVGRWYNAVSSRPSAKA